MNLNDLLLAKNIDPQQVLVLRHRPTEPELNKVLPLLAAQKPDVFNAYQQTQTKKLEKAMQGVGYIASFIGQEPGKALFIGLYSIGKSRPLTKKQYWEIPAYVEMKKFGMRGFTAEDSRTSVLWFDLALTDFHTSWKGKLIVQWPGGERTWWRRAHRNEMLIAAILEDSALEAAMPAWDEIALTWEILKILPGRWRSALSQWRGIYYILDVSDGKGYVGSAYGADNLLGRWLNYAASGHGGNTLLRKRDPQQFRFSILQRVSPDLDPNEVVRVERTWKERLRTRSPFGLNDN
ncbi:MAG TPA: GIY-YIG nuclease family protein [Candidatus Angelobacter sp.]